MTMRMHRNRVEFSGRRIESPCINSYCWDEEQENVKNLTTRARFSALINFHPLSFYCDSGCKKVVSI